MDFVYDILYILSFYLHVFPFYRFVDLFQSLFQINKMDFDG